MTNVINKKGGGAALHVDTSASQWRGREAHRLKKRHHGVRNSKTKAELFKKKNRGAKKAPG